MVSFSSGALAAIGGNRANGGETLIGTLVTTAALLEVLWEDQGNKGPHTLVQVTPSCKALSVQSGKERQWSSERIQEERRRQQR